MYKLPRYTAVALSQKTIILWQNPCGGDGPYAALKQYIPSITVITRELKPPHTQSLPVFMTCLLHQTWHRSPCLTSKSSVSTLWNQALLFCFSTKGRSLMCVSCVPDFQASRLDISHSISRSPILFPFVCRYPLTLIINRNLGRD